MTGTTRIPSPGPSTTATQPYYPQDSLAYYQPIQAPPPPPRRRRSGCCSCSLLLMLPLLALLGVLAVYFLAPLRTNVLILGIDRAPDGTALSRTDTIILLSVNPLLPTIEMLSIPRDLWVPIPVVGVGENRINTAHFYAEAARPGSGPEAALETIRQNFDVPVSYYLRFRFDAFTRIVDAMDGVSVDLPDAMGGLSAGTHHLDGQQALAFVRDRKGTDDFFRMGQGQLMVKAVAKQMLSPLSWPRLPLVAEAVFSSIDTNLPFWQWPRIGLAFVRGILFNQIDNRTITREMITPFITSGGADVLLPNWDLIHPYVNSMFLK